MPAAVATAAPHLFQRVHLYLMPILPVIAIEKQNARAGSRPIEPGRRVGITSSRSGCRPKDGDVRTNRRSVKLVWSPRLTRGALGKTIGERR
jgi:hypothetical protein